jgi:hypothetical protein
MNTKEAITALSQSEKIKSGIVWATHMTQMAGELPQNEKSGIEKSIKLLINMIGHESVLARRTTGDKTWINIEKDIDMALVMVNSGVSHEAAYHLSQALRQVTTISSRCMSFLVEKGLL